MHIAIESLPRMSVEEYLHYEHHNEIRHELVDGYLYAMTGGTDRHDEIAGNLYARLHTHLRGKPCRVHGSNVKVRVNNDFYYPDLFVRCGSERGDPYYKTDPVLIVEVLSPSTQRYDRGDKLLAYQKLDTLQDYLIIDQNDIRIEHYRRWHNWEAEVLSAKDKLQLTAIEFSCAVQEIYADLSA